MSDAPDPPVTEEDRVAAREAAAALRLAIADPETFDSVNFPHSVTTRRGRGFLTKTWDYLPGFVQERNVGVSGYRHELLPGWYYTRHEVRSEMIPDLERLAEHGVRPTEETG